MAGWLVGNLSLTQNLEKALAVDEPAGENHSPATTARRNRRHMQQSDVTKNVRPPGGRFDRRRPEQGLRINHRIRVPEVRVIADEEQLGVHAHA